ncbi:MAG: fructose-bisphosphate aldolase, partial [Actinobacteria bacterium]|nr:fructose-bisphosphate aldolase [Actinomycetota bacterium]
MPNTTIDVAKTLGTEADGLLSHTAKVSKSNLHLPGPDFVDRCFAPSDRSPQVLASLQR